MLSAVETIGRARGACKLTVEVPSGNDITLRPFRRMASADYQRDPAM